MVPLRHLLVMVGLALAITAAVIGAVYLAGPSPERSADAAGPGFSARALYRDRAPAVFAVTTMDGTGKAASGTGFLVDSEGRVLTNEHVIAGAQQITVDPGTGVGPLQARLLGADAGTDTALLEVDLPAGTAIAPIPLGDADSLSVGDPVLAIGSPFGLHRSASAGIISALGRQIQAPDGFPIPGAIQTDAAINHGNSGGPLLDRRGRAVAINTQIAASGVDGNVGVAFSVPIDVARANMDRWLAGELVGHAWIGVRAATVPAPLARRLGLADGGVQVLSVVPDGPAAAAGIQPADGTTRIDGADHPSGGDILLSAGSQPLRRFEDLQRTLEAASPGDELRLEVLRDTVRRPVTLNLSARP